MGENGFGGRGARSTKRLLSLDWEWDLGMCSEINKTNGWKGRNDAILLFLLFSLRTSLIGD
jgi:hypothetical protein